MARTTQDVVGFRRIFILFCTLVLLPAMLLSGFGVVAIDNERSALKLHQREAAIEELRTAETDLLELLQRSAQAVAAAAPSQLPARLTALRQRGLPIGPAFIAPTEGEPVFADEGMDDLLAVVLPRARRAAEGTSSGDVRHVDLEDGEFNALLVVIRAEADTLVGYLLDEDRLASSSARNLDGGRRVTLRVTKTGRAGPEPLSSWMSPIVRAETLAEGLLVERRLRHPFDRYSLQATGPEPAATTIVVYIVLLILFYVLLITGVVITSRLIWQEARLSRLKTDFVSHVSHELRTPLTSIRMFIETLRLGRASSPEEQEECLQLLGQETERLSEMIERVLGYARLKSGRRIFNLDREKPADLIGDALTAFRAQIVGAEASKAPSQRIEILTEVPTDLPAVVADREAVVEALLNLLGNAHKYTGEEKRIRVFARAARRRVIIGVEDNGPGLPKSEHARVFDRFYQAGAGLLNRTTEGSGLGLAITKSIIEGNRGKIYVESEEGAGATFFIELRVAKPTAAQTGAAAEAASERPATAAGGA